MKRDNPYQIVRVGIYLQRYEESQSRLGFIRESHRLDAQLGRKLTRQRNLLTSFISSLCHTDQLSKYAEWVATQPGDCVIFDPRILHSGSRISGLKYAMFLAFGVENLHFYNHHRYYRHHRSDLEYKPIPSELAAKNYGQQTYIRGCPILWTKLKTLGSHPSRMQYLVDYIVSDDSTMPDGVNEPMNKWFSHFTLLAFCTLF